MELALVEMVDLVEEHLLTPIPEDSPVALEVTLEEPVLERLHRISPEVEGDLT
jgi:hypothetical protein